MRALLFGKLPAHGDFVSRGLKPHERNELDRWLSASLTDARDAHGDAFEDRYDAAPPWRFAEGDGSGEWTAGAVAMSADAAGRRFPVFAAREGLDRSTALSVAAAAEALLFRAITESWSADATLAALGSADASNGSFAEQGWWTEGEGAPPRLAGPRPPSLARAMLDQAGAGA